MLYKQFGYLPLVPRSTHIMPLATRETVAEYLHKIYGIRPEKALALLQEPDLADLVLLGQLHDSFDYYVAEQIMDRITHESRLPTEGTPEYDQWIDPDWTPDEEALLECTEEEAGEEELNEDDPDESDPDEVNPDEEDEDEDAEEDAEDDDEAEADADDAELSSGNQHLVPPLFSNRLGHFDHYNNHLSPRS